MDEKEFVKMWTWFNLSGWGPAVSFCDDGESSCSLSGECYENQGTGM